MAAGRWKSPSVFFETHVQPYGRVVANEINKRWYEFMRAC